MNSLYEFDLELTVQGPVLTKSSSPSTFGVDSAVARDVRNERPYLPGTLVKGKLRESLEQLGERVAEIERWLGRDASSHDEVDPGRGRLVFGDLEARSNGHRNKLLHRVALDPDLGSARGEMLRVLEMPYGPGEEVAFSGKAYAYADAGTARELRRKLELGLRWVTQVGSLRTTGFGRLLNATVSVTEAAASASAAQDVRESATLALSISPLAPLCIARPKIGDNLFESHDVIPGNVLAGAVASTAQALGVEIPEFERIRFRHAFPTTRDRRPRVLPLSTVKVGNVPLDVAHLEGVHVFADRNRPAAAPAFPIDWKEYGDVTRALGWASPVRELRVRTKIDGEKRTADRGDGDEGGKLFAWELVHPRTSDDEKIVWRSYVDLCDVSNLEEVARKVQVVLGQLGFVSKTKARCRVECSVVPCDTVPELTTDGRLVLVLQTPALLADPRFQDVPDVSEKQGAISAESLLLLYRDAWGEISDGSLKLTHYFAEQFLAGGNYLARRFQAGRAYDPWLLTKEGSTFAFRVIDPDKAKDCLERWFSRGLTLPTWARNRYGEDWKTNPYRPQNGFGEIAPHEPEQTQSDGGSALVPQPIAPIASTRP